VRVEADVCNLIETRSQHGTTCHMSATSANAINCDCGYHAARSTVNKNSMSQKVQRTCTNSEPHHYAYVQVCGCCGIRSVNSYSYQSTIPLTDPRTNPRPRSSCQLCAVYPTVAFSDQWCADKRHLRPMKLKCLRPLSRTYIWWVVLGFALKRVVKNLNRF